MRAKRINENIDNILKPKHNKELNDVLKDTGFTINELRDIKKSFENLGIDIALYVEAGTFKIRPWVLSDRSDNIRVRTYTEEGAKNVFLSIKNNGVHDDDIKYYKPDGSLYDVFLFFKQAKNLLNKLKNNDGKM